MMRRTLSTAQCAPSPLEGEGWGGGWLTRPYRSPTPLPIIAGLPAMIDLPLKGGGYEHGEAAP